MKNFIRLFAAACLLAVTSAGAWQLDGRVVHVADGDTITVLDAQKSSHRIRLAGIDAPEKAQNWGSRSKQNLSALVMGRTVRVTGKKTDRYGRLVGTVSADGRDANLAQIRDGLAWVYGQYDKELTSQQRDLYYRAQADAQAAGRGLWQQSDPTPPWQWRRERKER